MKKILFIGLLAACTLAFMQPASAQVAMTATNALTLDTVTNAATKNLTKQIKAAGKITIVLTITKISGTVGGTATLQGSFDGTDYGALATAYTVTDATQVKVFELDNRRYNYYRIAVTGTGTMSASVKAKIQVN